MSNPVFLLLARAAGRLAWPLLALALAATPARASELNLVGERYHTADLIHRTIQALPACLKYCLLGIEIRVRITPWSYEVFYVPRVEHHLAALHVMAADRLAGEPYLEWAATAGVIQKALLDQFARVVPTLLGGSPILESGGGQTRVGQYGRQQSTVFKEVSVLGHPVALLPLLLSKTGVLTHENLTLGDGSSGGSSSSASGFIRSWTNWASQCFTNPNQCPISPLFPAGLISTIYKIKDVVDQIIRGVKRVKMAMQFVQIAKNLRRIANVVINQGTGAGGGVRIDRLLCPNKIKIFYPYYLSGVDALFWRSGWPITDVQYTATLLNPLSTDRIGGLGEVWGSLYPRHGFLNHDHPGRVAAVISARGAHLVADSKVTLRPKLTTQDAGGHWQAVSPVPSGTCEANIADLPTPVDAGGGYGYNLWARYECPLSEVGTRVAFIPYRYCFTE